MKPYSVYTGDEDSEMVRIDRQNEYLNRIVSKHLDAIFSTCNCPAILDVGCADGKNILLRLEKRDYSLLLGIDKNAQKIEMANKLYKNAKNTFLCCDTDDVQFKETLGDFLNRQGRATFDIIHISSVLLHLRNPQLVLDTLHEFLSPGGWLIIQEEDDGFNMVYPHESCFDDCFYVWYHSVESGDRLMGRKVPSMLISSGYENVIVQSTTVHSTDFNGEMKDNLWDMYFNSDLWVADNPSFYDASDAYGKFLQYKKAHAALKDAYMQGKFFVTLGVFYITARGKLR